MSSGPGRELMPMAMGARKYPLTSMCQGAGSATGVTSGATAAGGGGGVGCAVGGGAAGGSSEARSFLGDWSGAGDVLAGAPSPAGIS